VTTFDYGQTVRVTESAPEKWKPSSTGWIVGMRRADSEQLANEFNTYKNAMIYLVEFDELPDGIEIPEEMLVAHEAP
jgi:hypothetical protein